MTEEITSIPLTDGTVCTMSEIAASTLSEEFGIERARLKRGAGGYAQVVATPKAAAFRNAGEVPLIDLLAVYAYIMRDLEPGQRWVCADGDPRNLTRENIVPSALAEPQPEIESEQKIEKPSVFLDTPAIQWQLDTLAHALYTDTKWKDENGNEKTAKPLIAIVVDKLKNRALAQEVLGDITLQIVEQIRAGKFRGKSVGEFYSWIRTITRRQADEKLAGVLAGCIGDIENDRAELQLKKRLVDSGAEQEWLLRTEFSQSEGSAGYY